MDKDDRIEELEDDIELLDGEIKEIHIFIKDAIKDLKNIIYNFEQVI